MDRLVIRSLACGCIERRTRPLRLSWPRTHMVTVSPEHSSPLPEAPVNNATQHIAEPKNRRHRNLQQARASVR